MADDSPRAVLTLDFVSLVGHVCVVVSYPPTRGALFLAARARAAAREASSSARVASSSVIDEAPSFHATSSRSTSSRATQRACDSDVISRQHKHKAPHRWWDTLGATVREDRETTRDDSFSGRAVDGEEKNKQKLRDVPEIPPKLAARETEKPKRVATFAPSRPGWRGGGIAVNKKKNANLLDGVASPPVVKFQAIGGNVNTTVMMRQEPMRLRRENEPFEKRNHSKKSEIVSQPSLKNVPPRVRAKARATKIASLEHSGGSYQGGPREKTSCDARNTSFQKTTTNARVGGVPSTLGLVKCSNCGTKQCSVLVTSSQNNSRRDGLWVDQGTHRGVIRKGAQGVNMTKKITEPLGSGTSNFAPCARCGDVFYCSPECASEDWQRHRKNNECAGVRSGFGFIDGTSVGNIDLGYVRGERVGSTARDGFLRTSVGRGR